MSVDLSEASDCLSLAACLFLNYVAHPLSCNVARELLEEQLDDTDKEDHPWLEEAPKQNLENEEEMEKALAQAEEEWRDQQEGSYRLQRYSFTALRPHQCAVELFVAEH